jgi:hypothetical protein
MVTLRLVLVGLALAGSQPALAQQVPVEVHSTSEDTPPPPNPQIIYQQRYQVNYGGGFFNLHLGVHNFYAFEVFTVLEPSCPRDALRGVSLKGYLPDRGWVDAQLLLEGETVVGFPGERPTWLQVTMHQDRYVNVTCAVQVRAYE